MGTKVKILEEIGPPYAGGTTNKSKYFERIL